MIYIEIRIGRTAPANHADQASPARASAAAVLRDGPSQHGVRLHGPSQHGPRQQGVRIGNGGAAAVLLLALAALLLGFVPSSDTPEAHTVAYADALPRVAAPIAPLGGAAACVSTAPSQVEPTAAETVPAIADDDFASAADDDFRATASGADLADALRIDVSARPPVDESPPPTPTSIAPKTPRIAAREAAPDRIAAPVLFNITRGESAELQWLQQALREAAGEAMRSGDWSIVQSLRARNGAPPSLAFAKWDARIALAVGTAADAVNALAPFADSLDDEAERLRAVALLRTDAAGAAIDVYRALLAVHPEDAQLWLGLGIALEAAASDAEAIQFAYAQSLHLAQDPLIRTLARAHLDSPSA